jgi:hypothetical protein
MTIRSNTATGSSHSARLSDIKRKRGADRVAIVTFSGLMIGIFEFAVFDVTPERVWKVLRDIRGE